MIRNGSIDDGVMTFSNPIQRRMEDAA